MPDIEIPAQTATGTLIVMAYRIRRGLAVTRGWGLAEPGYVIIHIQSGLRVGASVYPRLKDVYTALNILTADLDWDQPRDDILAKPEYQEAACKLLEL